jgi:hypothetical protein
MRLTRLILVLMLAMVAPLSGGAAETVRLWSFEQHGFGDEATWPTDHCFLYRDGLWHLFYTHRPTSQEPQKSIGHAVSTDLRDWEDRSTVIEANGSAPFWRAFDVWAPQVVEWPQGGYVMTFTGSNEHWSQRPAFLFSDDLETWTELPEYPPLLPDSTRYYWGESIDNDCRDSHLIQYGGIWHLLYAARTTAGVPAIAHSSSPDLKTWQHHDPLLTVTGGSWSSPDLESPGMLFYDSQYILFFTFDGVRKLRSPAFDGPWDFNQAYLLKITASGGELFPSDTGLLFSNNQLSACDQSQHVIWCDSLDTSGWPYQRIPHPRTTGFEFFTGNAFYEQPTFGDPPLARGELSAGRVGMFWFSSRELYPEPNQLIPCSADRGSSPQGEARTPPFVLVGDSLQLRISGGADSDSLRVSLNDCCTNQELAAFTPTSPTLEMKSASVAPYRGQLVEWRIVDRLSRAGAWIGVDHIEERRSPGLPVPADLPVVTWIWPTGGEIVGSGETRQLKWLVTHAAKVDSLVLYNNFEDGKTLQRYVSLGGKKKQYAWTVPDTLAFYARWRLVAYSETGVWGCGDSEPFHINVTTNANDSEARGLLQTVFRNGSLYLEGSIPRGVGGEAALEIYDIRGRHLATPWIGEAGRHFAVPAPRQDHSGRRLPSGIYFARLRHGNSSWQAKYVLVSGATR